MAFKTISLILLAATGTQALWLAAAEMTFYTNTPGGVFPSPACQVGKGDTEAQAWSQATSIGSDSVSIGGGVTTCGTLASHHSNQLGGFWDDYGTLNYEDDNWHWYCQPRLQGATGGTCDAGNGSPKKKRSVEFEA